MGTTFVALPAPAGNGSGAAVDVSTFGAEKTVVVEGNGSGNYEPYVLIEIANDAAGVNWTPLVMFRRPGERTIAVACRWMRATVKNYNTTVNPGAPTVNVGGEDTGASFATLVAPAGNGNGAPVDVSALPPFKTIQVTGAFKGALNIMISNDAGATYSQLTTFQPNKNGILSGVVIAEFMKINRTGISSGAPDPGLPVITIAATDVVGAGDGGIEAENAGVAVAGGPFSTLNFPANTGVNAMDGGGGVLDIHGRLGAALAADVAVDNNETVVCSLLVPANTLRAQATFLIMGAMIQVGAVGSTPTFRVRVGPVSLAGNVATSVVGVSNAAARPSMYQGNITVRTIGAGGTVQGASEHVKSDGAGYDNTSRTIEAAPVAIDTTVDNLIELTAISGDAGVVQRFEDAFISQVV